MSMKAVVFHGVGDIRLEDVPEPQIKEPTDAIVRLTSTAVCGTDLHIVRGTMSMMEPGTILGHEGVGIIEEVGPAVRNLKEGERVVIASTIACGYCSYCRSGYYAQCDNSNPNGKRAGTAFFGGPKTTGPFHGLQAEKARVPFANVGCVKVDGLTDDEAILLSDIFPTGYFGAELAKIHKGHTVAVFGCGPVGQFTILSAKLFGAGRIFAIDRVPCRLDMARTQGAEVIDFSKEDPVDAILSMTGGIGVDRAIDAVGVDAESPRTGPAAEKVKKEKEEYERELRQVAPETKQKGNAWKPGDAPSLALAWAVDALAKAGVLSIIGIYPQTVKLFPIGQAMMKNIRIHTGNCNHRRYMPMLVDMVQSGVAHPTKILTNIEPFSSILDAYEAFDRRQPGWIKVELKQAA
jgi:threonine dehydrogenase-like Zn-dependent dehydrogenase